MIVNDEKQYKMAFKELLVILENIPKADYNKIPEDIIKKLEKNADYTYNYEFDPKKDINEQKMSELTKAMLENFYRDYWVTNIERKKILQEENIKREKMEDEKRKKYNPDNIF